MRRAVVRHIDANECSVSYASGRFMRLRAPVDGGYIRDVTVPPCYPMIYDGLSGSPHGNPLSWNPASGTLADMIRRQVKKQFQRRAGARAGAK